MIYTPLKTGDKVKTKTGFKEYIVRYVTNNKVYVEGRITPLSLYDIEYLQPRAKPVFTPPAMSTTNIDRSVNKAQPLQQLQPSRPKSLEDRYTDIVGNIQTMSQEINDSTALSSSKQLEDLFSKAKESLESYNKVKVKDTSGWFSKFISADKKKERELVTISQNTDYLFSLINKEYQTLVDTGTKFQALKVDMTQQLKELQVLLEESNTEVQQFLDNDEMVPMKLISTNSQITASCEAYKAKLLKIEAGITMTTGAVISLGSKLPTMRAGIADETSYAALIDSVSNVHGMFSSTAELMFGIADMTSSEVFKKVNDIMHSQIQDNSTIQYLESRQKHTAELANMIATNAELLSDKLMNESSTIKQIALENITGLSRERLVQLNKGSIGLDTRLQETIPPKPRMYPIDKE